MYIHTHIYIYASLIGDIDFDTGHRSNARQLKRKKEIHKSVYIYIFMHAYLSIYLYLYLSISISISI